MTSTIYGKEFRIKSGTNSSVIIEVLSKSAIENNCCRLMQQRVVFIYECGRNYKDTVVDNPGIIVDGQKWSNNCEGASALEQK